MLVSLGVRSGAGVGRSCFIFFMVIYTMGATPTKHAALIRQDKDHAIVGIVESFVDTIQLDPNATDSNGEPVSSSSYPIGLVIHDRKTGDLSHVFFTKHGKYGGDNGYRYQADIDAMPAVTDDEVNKKKIAQAVMLIRNVMFADHEHQYTSTIAIDQSSPNNLDVDEATLTLTPTYGEPIVSAWKLPDWAPGKGKSMVATCDSCAYMPAVDMVVNYKAFLTTSISFDDFENWDADTCAKSADGDCGDDSSTTTLMMVIMFMVIIMIGRYMFSRLGGKSKTAVAPVLDSAAY